ncbi:hypothetical protein ABS767_03860 [Sphingomonas sp. ST-64]|uniref:DUF2059 domain-containing protein n=1 Tax=Sphingomonas plantiphila TaxID=3163295 RepID=A0ABW8YLJ6_9SPHN
MLTIMLSIAMQAATPSAEALDLGRRLAAHGTLATLAPMLIEKDTAELASEAKTLSDSERDRLQALGREIGAKGTKRIVDAIGSAYAARLSIEDLRLLVAQAENPAAARRRAVEVPALVEAMAAVGELDFKKDLAAAFCKETGKLCTRR